MTRDQARVPRRRPSTHRWLGWQKWCSMRYSMTRYTSRGEWREGDDRTIG